MPEINLISVPLYDPMHPYHWEYDNLPLRVLMQREELINAAVDINSQIIRDAAGDQGTVANRLNQSMEENGNLKTIAIDEALHNIGWHEDGEYDGVDYATDEHITYV